MKATADKISPTGRCAGLAAALAILGACNGDHMATSMPMSTPSLMIVGSGVVVSETRPVSGFTALTVAGPLRVVIEQTGTESLVVAADDNVLPVVRTEVSGGRLYLGFASHTSMTRLSEVVCRITVRELREVEASGAARLQISSLESAELGIRLSGATTASASGSVERLALDVSGASRFSGGALGSRAVTARISGAGYALVRATDSLVAHLSGMSLLEYYGSPNLSSTVDGLSEVRRLEP